MTLQRRFSTPPSTFTPSLLTPTRRRSSRTKEWIDRSLSLDSLRHLEVGHVRPLQPVGESLSVDVVFRYLVPLPSRSLPSTPPYRQHPPCHTASASHHSVHARSSMHITTTVPVLLLAARTYPSSPSADSGADTRRLPPRRRSRRSPRGVLPQRRLSARPRRSSLLRRDPLPSPRRVRRERHLPRQRRLRA